MIEYAGELTGVEPQHLDGFFVGWPSPPSPERHLEVLRRSSHVVVARDGERVVGFVTAISDASSARTSRCWRSCRSTRAAASARSSSAGCSPGSTASTWSISGCDEDVVGFYERLGLERWDAGMGVRNRHVL